MSESHEKTAAEYRYERDELFKAMSAISKILTGKKDWSFIEIIQAIINCKSKAYKHEQNKKVEDLFDLIDDLTEAKREIIEDT